MKELIFLADNSCISTQQLAELEPRIRKEIKKAHEELKKKYNTDYASLYLPEDISMLEHIETVAHQVRSLQPSMVVLVGIGGSNLGTVALFEALRGIFYNDLNPFYTFYYADTIDSDKNRQLLTRAEQELEKGNRVVVVIVTKSGKTTETLVNGALYLALLKKYFPHDYQKLMVIITDKGSALYIVAKKYGFTLLEIPQYVGGRYSVLSAVGLFPLALYNIDCKALLAGALTMRHRCLQEDIQENYAALSAVNVYRYYKSGRNIYDTFIFSPTLAQLGAWYKQLVGESLGKSHTLSGQQVNVGITPTVSIGTTDLHSVAQLYLGGPQDKISTFIYSEQEAPEIIVPNNELIEPLSFLKGQSLSAVKYAIYQGVKKAYIYQKRPFLELLLPEKSPYILGQFLMMKMCEVIYLGGLLEINPFDQPAVELYKEETRKILNINNGTSR